MDPTLEEKQNNQSQEKQLGQGIIGRGMVPFNKFGSRVVLQVGRSLFTFLFTTPAGWVILAITILVIVVFAIVFAGPSSGIPGAPTAEQNNQTLYPSPTAEPTLTSSPTETLMPTPEP